LLNERISGCASEVRACATRETDDKRAIHVSLDNALKPADAIKIRSERTRASAVPCIPAWYSCQRPRLRTSRRKFEPDNDRRACKVSESANSCPRKGRISAGPMTHSDFHPVVQRDGITKSGQLELHGPPFVKRHSDAAEPPRRQRIVFTHEVSQYFTRIYQLVGRIRVLHGTRIGARSVRSLRRISALLVAF